MKRARIVLLLLFLTSWFGLDIGTSEAAWRNRSARVRSPRPITGYGANLHRRFVLEQEVRRAAQGKRVRYRGNIRWR